MYEVRGQQPGRRCWWWLSLVSLAMVLGCTAGRRLALEVRDRIGEQPTEVGLSWELLRARQADEAAGEIAPVVVPSVEEIQRVVSSVTPVQYRVITSQDVAAYAARSVTAELLNMESDIAWCAGLCDPRHCNQWQLEERVLALRVAEERERSVSEALQLFWALAEAERLQDLLRRSVAIIERGKKDAETLQTAGLLPGEQVTTLELQRLAFQQQLSSAEERIRQLNTQLASLLRMDMPTDGRLWPQAEWRLNTDIPEIEGCIQHALTNRPDIRLLELLQEELRADTVAAVRRALSAHIAVLGVAPTIQRLWRRWWQCACADAEAVVRRVQLDRLTEDYRQHVIGQVRQKHHELAIALVEAARAGEIRDLYRRRRDEFVAARQAGRGSVAEPMRAELDLLKAEADLTSKIAEAKRAALALARACGRAAEPLSHQATLPSREDGS